MSSSAARLRLLHTEIEGCTACPRLVARRAEVDRDKRRSYRDDDYWSRPISGFGDPAARLLVLGLAPGAHGANRTGRVFTGDRSGDFLYAALHRAGLANQARSEGRGDGLRLHDVFITLPVRCVPPDNAPARDELARCRGWLEQELALLPGVRSVLALGAIAYAAMTSGPAALQAPAPRFAHGAQARVRWPLSAEKRGAGQVAVFASYHVSQQNTQTGRLTPAMFDEVLLRAVAAGRREPRGPG